MKKLLFIPLSILWMEIIFFYSTKRVLPGHYMVPLTLLSLSYGLFVSFLISLCKVHRVMMILESVFLTLLGFIFASFYVLFCEFQVMYDINTLFFGAKDALTHFANHLIPIIFSPEGVIYIMCFFLPLIVFLFTDKKWQLSYPVKGKIKLLYIGGFAAFYLSAFCMIFLNEKDYVIYKTNYNYQDAVKSFGLLTGIRLDMIHMLRSTRYEPVFDIPDNVDAVGSVYSVSENKEIPETIKELEITKYWTDSTNGKEATDEKIEENVPRDNAVEIDFETLLCKDNGTFQNLDSYVCSLSPSKTNNFTGVFKGKNLIFFTAEAFTEEVIDEKRTPTLYRLANKGIQFTDYYQPASAGTTGGEYSNIFGMLPATGGKSMKDTKDHLNWITMGYRLTEEGYYGKAYHNNSYDFYDRDETHVNLGYSDGYEGRGNGLEDILSPVWPESDLEMVEGTLPTYVDKAPFNIYYMTVSGHGQYTYDQNAMARKNWDIVKDLPYGEPVKVYLGAQQELENALSYLVDELEKRDIAKDTVIVISTDHFPYGLDQNSGGNSNLTQLYGKPIENEFDRDHNRLIIWCGCLEDEAPIVIDTPTTSMDILPTLCNLFGVRYDSRLLPGRDVFSDVPPLAFTLSYAWKTDLGMYLPREGFIPFVLEEELPENYVQTIQSIVKNKINYSKGVLQKDYFRHLFGDN